MSAELRDQVQASLGPNFTLERELGGGGMSRVFMARDAALDRAVVVKVLSGEFTSGVSADRFRREIQLIARLQHPHVVPILSAGASEGGLYYTMPFFGGETLRARLTREGPMPIAQAIKILREVLDALSFAHSHGVIHRDIKPENILLEAGHAVVADFGIAKALKESGSLTSTGMAVGTPAYMAPEQASADPSTDHRADLYAVGVIAYEMLSGAPPFIGSPQQIIRAHMVESPTPLLQRRPDVPAPLSQLIMRTLEKEASRRPQSADEMLTVVDSVVTPSTTQANVAEAKSPRRPMNRMLAVAGAIAIVAVAAAAWRFTRPPVIAGAQSIAIAPFSVASGDSALTRLGQNLVTTISANLDGVGEIRVADAMAVLSHAKSLGHLLAASDAMAIARKLGAKSVVQGTLAPAGENLRADAVLLDASSGAQLARVSVTAPAGDVAAMTDSLTWALLRAVWGRGRAPTPAVSGITTHSQASLREYLDGERLMARGDPYGAADAYKRAINADTTFWFAHYRYRLARAWVGLTPETTITRRLTRHINDLPERERALVSTIDSAYGKATPRIEAYRRLTERYPDYAPAWVTLADYLIHQGGYAGFHIREAIGPWKQVIRLVPNDEEAANHLAFACVAAEDTTCIHPAFAHLDSIVRADTAPAAGPRHALRSLTLVLQPPRRSLTDSLIEVGKKDGVLPVASYVQRQMFAAAVAANPGLVAEWDRINAEEVRSNAAVDPTHIGRHEAQTYDAVRGDFGGINDAIAEWRDPSPQAIAMYSRLHPMRLRALGELQGLVAPDAITGREALAAAAAPGRAATIRYDAYWMDGLNALLLNDTGRFDERVRALTSDTSRLAKFALRSLRAIAAGRSGQHAQAAESLLVLEREHGESSARVFGAYAADRLLAAQWLADEKRYAIADSLLYFTRGFNFLSGGEAAEAIFAPAQLIRSRIAEGMGDNAAAVRFAQIFLSTFDRAPVSQKPLIDEAKNRIARLGIGDKPRTVK